MLQIPRKFIEIPILCICYFLKSYFKSAACKGSGDKRHRPEMAFFAPHIVEPNAKHTYTVILFCGRDSNSSNLEKSFSIPDPPPTRASQHALLHVDGRSTHPEIGGAARSKKT
ncbi:hypothetical protein I7I53_09790 [Histoplasma capsulatum var. duboisii H88]|uniref:Uncharacterized protein n=1 Tax=Ajellomyces capsulatus (strain H88) TaxID=544711 RepID=A0A8A1LAG9_AJEC8|nr:hypothetical protein I7I53_09790 [Histoplasma capsulatum var. duboisii H88]